VMGCGFASSALPPLPSGAPTRSLRT
jgi:hypothetical protein